MTDLAAWVGLLVAFVLVLLNGFFVLAEFAIVKVRPTRIEERAQKGERRARRARQLLARMSDYLSLSQVGITICSIAIGWLGEPALAHLLEGPLRSIGVTSPAVVHSIALIIAFLLIIFVHITIGEQVPKMLAIRRSEKSTLAVTEPMRLFFFLFYLPTVLLNKASMAMLRLVGLGPDQLKEKPHSERELRMLLASSHADGVFSFDRLLLFENLLDFGRLTVSDAMLPIEKAVLLDADAGWKETVATIRLNLFTRYVVVSGAERQPVGVLHIKDLTLATLDTAEPVDWRKYTRPVQTLRRDSKLEEVLRLFQRRRIHLAVVKDADGSLCGQVTLEDILEELIGSIEDEFAHEAVHDLAELIHQEAVFPNLGEGALAEVLPRMLQPLVRGEPPLDAEAVANRIKLGKMVISTEPGEGLAVPHARLKELIAPRLAVGLSRPGLEVPAAKEAPAPQAVARVHFVFLVLTPEKLPPAHEQLLERIMALLESAYVRDKLLKAQSASEVLEIIRTGAPRTLS